MNIITLPTTATQNLQYLPVRWEIKNNTAPPDSAPWRPLHGLHDGLPPPLAPGRGIVRWNIELEHYLAAPSSFSDHLAWALRGTLPDTDEDDADDEEALMSKPPLLPVYLSSTENPPLLLNCGILTLAPLSPVLPPPPPFGSAGAFIEDDDDKEYRDDSTSMAFSSVPACKAPSIAPLPPPWNPPPSSSRPVRSPLSGVVSSSVPHWPIAAKSDTRRRKWPYSVEAMM
jgi:hypothetical protein